MRRDMTHSALTFASVLMIVALAGCGGGSGKTAATLPSMPVMTPGDSPLTPGATSIPPGESRTVGDADGVRTVATCPQDGPACVFTVAEDGSATFTGGAPELTTYTPITGLPEGPHMLESGTLSPGESRVVQESAGMRTVLTCPAGGEDCVVTVGDDGAAAYTGGAPTVATYTPVDLPGGHSLASGTTIPAGVSRTVWSEGAAETVVTCPAGGEDCVFRVVDGAAESTGMPTVVTSITGLPEGHTLTAGTTIPAGTTISVGEEGRILGYSRGRGSEGSGVACPAGGEDCFFAWVSGSTAEVEGGTPTLTTLTNEMVWQANNGPDGTSDGAHATGFEGRMLSGSTLHSMFANQAEGWVQKRGAIVHSSLHPDPLVTETASWDSGTAPTLSLNVDTSPLDGPPLVDPDRWIPSLGEGWNGVALGETGELYTGNAVIYSNIEKAVGETQDEYYLTLGAWIAMPVDPAGAVTDYDWGAFANGHAATALSRAQIRALTGSATYSGPATGLYSKATFTGSGSTRALQSSHIGSFTATATINADFDAGANMYGTMGGSITDFRENGASLGEWTVTLPATESVISTASEVFAGSHSGGSADGQALTGEWGVQPYRNSATSGAEMVVGTWTASTAATNNDALHMVGAFAGERQ